MSFPFPLPSLAEGLGERCAANNLAAFASYVTNGVTKTGLLRCSVYSTDVTLKNQRCAVKAGQIND